MKLLPLDDVYKIFQLFDVNLRKHPKKIPIRGFLKNIINRTLDYAVYVNKWPEFNTVIVKPKDGQTASLYRVGIYSSDPKSVQHILCQPGFLPKMTPIRIYGLAMDLVPTVEELADSLNLYATVLCKADPRIITTYKNSNFRAVNNDGVTSAASNNQLPKEFRYCTLNPDIHTNMILSSWMDHNGSDFFINREEAIAAIRCYLSIKPALGVVRKADDQLVSWMISDLDTSGRIAITVPEYRGHVIATCLFAEFGRQSLQYNDVLWGYIPINNISSIEFSKRFGCYFYPEVEFVHCILRPKEGRVSANL